MGICDVIDAVVTDLQSEADSLGLPAFAVQRYVQPLLESAEMLKPILAVYVFDDAPVLIDTSGAYDHGHTVRIGWYAPVPESLESGFVDQAKARAAIVQSEAVFGRVGTYYAGIPGLTGPPFTEVTLVRARWGKVRGGVYGVELDIRVSVYA